MLLTERLASSRFIFVVGKGGVGKTTAAAAIALSCADAGEPTHLLSTDPAHSIADVFGHPVGGQPRPSSCSQLLTLEELDAAAAARDWLARATGPVAEIIEHGTYLDAEDVAGFTRLALPGLDEMMAVLRLVELARGDARVVVDTAPTGHTIRLLDAAATHEGLARALRAMAEKAATVASSLARRPLRLAGESIIDELDDLVRTYREQVLAPAAFVIAARCDDVVMAETRRLGDALEQRRLHVAATVYTGSHARYAAGGECFTVPLLAGVTGCDGLRRWLAHVRSCTWDGTPVDLAPPPGEDAPADVTQATAPDGAAAAWLQALGARVLIFAGKGGVGKTTCAAAAALCLSGSRDVVLCSADPAGSLDDVFGRDVTTTGRAGPRLRVLQVDAEAELERARERYRDEVLEALERIGLSHSAALDRRVVETLLDLAPPGIDEFAALAAIIDAAASHETVVLDTAPTGHFLRLLTMPGLAMDWTRQLMRILVKYRAAGAAGGTAETLLRTARELRALEDLLHDGARTGVVVVALDEPMVAAETGRLMDALHEAGVPVLARLTNRSRSRSEADAGWTELEAPALAEPPRGDVGLRNFLETWRMPG